MAPVPFRLVKWAHPGHKSGATMMKLLKKLLRDEDGPTTVEYAVMLALIVGLCIGAVNAMAVATASSFDQSASELDGVLG